MRKRRQKIYFSQQTEDAIILYNNEEDPSIRNKIYLEHIHAPFDKLAENVIHTFKMYNFDVPYEDVKQEVISFLIQKIHHYSQDKGKAFSYFSIVAKNYLIANNNSNYYMKQKRRDVTTIDTERNVVNEYIREDFIDDTKNFTNEFVVFLEKNIDQIFIKNKDVEVADAIKDLFKYRENIENYNKKALYILIRERTGVKTQNITSVVNVIKKLYADLYLIFRKTGTIHNITLDDI